MAAIDYDSELRRAGAHATHGWRRLAFLAQRYVLGTFGLIIMVLFVWTALSADLIARYDPLTVDSAHRLAPPSWTHWLGTDSFGRAVWSRLIQRARLLPARRFLRPRRLEPHYPRRTHFARGRRRFDRARRLHRRHGRPCLRLSVRL